MSGIRISANFDLRTAQPLDGRTIAQTLAERNNMLFAYIGLRVFVAETSKEYLLTNLPATNSNNWQEAGVGAQQILVTVEENGQTVFPLPANTTVLKMTINGMQQSQGNDWQQISNELQWVSTDFAIETNDTIYLETL